MNSSALEFVWFFFMISVSVKFLILFMNCFPDFVGFLCFPAACFLKKAIFYQLSRQLHAFEFGYWRGGLLSSSVDMFP